MGTNANVITIKPQGIFTADVATALPTITGTKGSAITMTGWDDLGFVDAEGSVSITFGKTVRLVRPMGFEGPLKGIVTEKSAMIEFNGLEETVEALELALGFGTLASNEIPDGGTGELGYKAVAFVTDNIVYHFKKMSSAEDVNKVVDDAEEAKMPFKLGAFVEEAATAGERMWNILERTAA